MKNKIKKIKDFISKIFDRQELYNLDEKTRIDIMLQELKDLYYLGL